MAGTFDNLVAALGREATEKLVAAYGGTRVYVPVRAAPESAFAVLIGHAAAEALSRYYGGERFEAGATRAARRNLPSAPRRNACDRDRAGAGMHAPLCVSDS